MLKQINNGDSLKLNEFLQKFKKITKNPEIFLRPQSEKTDKIKEFLKEFYDSTIDDVEKCSNSILPELEVVDLDDEQIWQQIELKNEAKWNEFLENTSKILAIDDDHFKFQIGAAGDENEGSDNDDEYNNGFDSEDEEVDDEEENGTDSDDSEMETRSKSQPKKKETIKIIPSIVDDKFFKLSELEAFLISEDRKEEARMKNSVKKFQFNEEENDDDMIDYFDENLGIEVGDDDDDNDYDDDDENNENNNDGQLNYEDFFDVNDEDRKLLKLQKKKRCDGNFKDYFTEDNDDENISTEHEKENVETKRKRNKQKGKVQEEVDEGEDEAEEIDEEEEAEEIDEEEEAEEEEEPEAGEDEREDYNNYRNDNRTEITDNLNSQEAFENNDDEHLTKTKDLKSTFEQRQERLNLRINDLEEIALSEKPWQLKGEITAQNRPQNSLLEEILEFDSNIRPAPVITEKTNQTLEGIIRQRVVDKAWDDVEQCVRPVQTPQELRKKLILDQEKSKESLAQIYEKEYQNEVKQLNADSVDVLEEEPKEHKLIRKMLTKIFKKLDALSNFHFVPKPVAPEPKIITNTPVVHFEEVAPLAVSDAKLLAPEEIRANAKGDVFGKSERSKTDKKRDRRHKKLRQKAIFKAKESHQLEKQSKGIKLTTKEDKQKVYNKVIKNRNVSKMAEGVDNKNIKSSKAFFSQLQDKSSGTKLKRKQDFKSEKSDYSAKKLKL